MCVLIRTYTIQVSEPHSMRRHPRLAPDSTLPSTRFLKAHITPRRQKESKPRGVRGIVKGTNVCKHAHECMTLRWGGGLHSEGLETSRYRFGSGDSLTCQWGLALWGLHARGLENQCLPCLDLATHSPDLRGLHSVVYTLESRESRANDFGSGGLENLGLPIVGSADPLT